MEVSFNNNSASLNSIQRREDERQNSTERLASAVRINRAADDPAGLQISERLTAEINSSQQRSINAQDQVNINRVQEGQLSAINEGLQRANVLSLQSGNSAADRDAIQAELDQIAEQVNTLASEALGDDSFISGLDASDPQASQAILDNAFTQIGESASALGAQSNALSSQSSTFQTTVVNTSQSRSRIEDTDFSQVTTEQQQAGVQLRAAR